MRTDCKFYESRTYPSGDVVRKCDLDLAPEAPWRCPDDCPAYQRRSDIAWQFGSLSHRETPDEPPNLDDGAAELLDLAEDIINEAGMRVRIEVDAEREQRQQRGWRRFFGRRR
jgi:hypothetical protein